MLETLWSRRHVLRALGLTTMLMIPYRARARLQEEMAQRARNLIESLTEASDLRCCIRLRLTSDTMALFSSPPARTVVRPDDLRTTRAGLGPLRRRAERTRHRENPRGAADGSHLG